MYMHAKAKLRQIWIRTWALELLSWVPPRPRACPGHRWCYLRKAINKYIYCELFTICFKLFNNYNIIITWTAYTIILYYKSYASNILGLFNNRQRHRQR